MRFMSASIAAAFLLTGSIASAVVQMIPVSRYAVQDNKLSIWTDLSTGKGFILQFSSPDSAMMQTCIKAAMLTLTNSDLSMQVYDSKGAMPASASISTATPIAMNGIASCGNMNMKADSYTVTVPDSSSTRQ
jgi:hypothetical protein